MADTSQVETEQSSELAPIDFPEDVDPELATWLNRFEAMQMSMDVTLTVDGFLIAGSPQSEADFYRTVGDVFAGAFSRARLHGDDGVVTVDLPEAAQQARETMERVAARYDLPRVDADSSDNESRERAEAVKEEMLTAFRRHVMLKDVVILTPSGEYLHQRQWRGRLSHVSGWFFGRPAGMEYESAE